MRGLNLFANGVTPLDGPASIIYLGNYTEAGSTPVVREPQIIERKLLGVSAGDGVPAAEPPEIVKRFLPTGPLILLPFTASMELSKVIGY